jgi:hypothetical protein
MKGLAAAVMVLTMMMPAQAADMRIVCEEREGLIQRLDLTLPDGGEPVLVLSVADESGVYPETPRILSHVLTRAGAMLNGGPFSTIHAEFKVTDEKGVTRIYTPQTYYVDWDRAKVWKSFFSLMDMPGSGPVENCVRVD